MATVLSQFDPEDDQNKQQQNQGQGQTPTFQAPTVGGPQGGGVATPGSSSGAGSNPVTPAGTSSGSFQNLSKYINANKDFKPDQGGLAGSMVNNINQQSQQTQQNIQNAGNAFNTQAQQATNAFTNPDLVNQAFQDPTAFTQNKDNLDKFAASRDASYTGPNTLQDLKGDQSLANLQVQTANLNDTVNQAQSEGGRYNLLRQMFGTPNYSKGQQGLDNLLIQGNQDQMKQIQGSRQAATTAANTLNQNEQNAEQTAAQGQQQAASTQADVRNRLNQAVQDQNTSIQGEVAQAQTAQQAAANKFSDALSKGFISQADYDRFHAANPGFASGMNTFGIDPNAYISTAGTLTPQTVATANDYAKLSALAQLSGGTVNAPGQALNPTAGSILQSFQDPTQAGTFSSNPQYNLDVGGYLQAINQAKDAQTAKLNPIQSQIDQYNAALNSNENSYGDNTGLLGQLYAAINPVTMTTGRSSGDYSAAPTQQYSTTLDPTIAAQLQKSGQTPLQYYEQQNNLGNVDVNGTYAPGSNQWLAQQIQQNQNSLASAKDKYSQLQNMMNKALHVGDAPVDPATGAAMGYIAGPALGSDVMGAGSIGPTTYGPSGSVAMSPADIASITGASRT